MLSIDSHELRAQLDNFLVNLGEIRWALNLKLVRLWSLNLFFFFILFPLFFLVVLFSKQRFSKLLLFVNTFHLLLNLFAFFFQLLIVHFLELLQVIGPVWVAVLTKEIIFSIIFHMLVDHVCELLSIRTYFLNQNIDNFLHVVRWHEN